MGSGRYLPRGLAVWTPTAPKTWARNDEDCEWELDQTLSLGDDTTEIVAGKFSRDLDLVFTAENMSDLFNFSYGHFKKICSIIRTCLETPNYSEMNDLTAAITETSEFNYLSEDEWARDTLYNMCTLNTYFDAED